MTTLLLFGLMFLGAMASLLVVPLILLRVLFGVSLAILSVPLQIAGALVGGLLRILVKGAFWLAVILIPLALVALPFTVLAFLGWLLYRALRPRRRVREAYVVA